jgi:radical SAM superfamily enzyme YgiQ (UPF0313 family)
LSDHGKKIVLAATDSESNEFLQSSWRQMLLATLPQKYAHYFTGWSLTNETWPDGQAKYVPNGLRVVEAILRQRFPAEDIAVCYPDQLHLFVGPDTRVVGIHAHNPLGITFATDVYSGFYGRDAEPINAAEFRRLITHPVLRKYKPNFKLIVGGPGGWQIQQKDLQAEWAIDTIVNGEAEDKVLDLFTSAMNGDALPHSVDCKSPPLDRIPLIHGRSTFGVVEITRGCGRGCQFCSVALRAGKSLPLDHILENTRRQVAQGAESILLVTEDLFLYEQGPRFATNTPALKRLFQSVAAVPGVKNVMMTHGTMAPAVVDPDVIAELSEVAVGKSLLQHPASTHPDHRYAMMFVGLETGSTRLFEKFMKGKSYPFKPAQWPDVVLKGMEVMNRHNWFPMCTFIVGLPGETREDTKQSLDLLFSLKNAKWCAIPTLFTPLEETRLGKQRSARVVELTDLQWEFFITCWRYNIDFFRSSPGFQWKFNIGIPLYYPLMGRKLFGPAIRYPLYRLAHFPEWYLRRKLYLDFSGRMEPRHMTPDHVPIPDHPMRPLLPVLGSD